MANEVRNQIRFIGNKHVSDCMIEINRRLQLDNNPNDPNGLGKIGRVLYGLEGDASFLSYDQVGGKWIYYDFDDDDTLVVFTGWDPARKFQDYLLSKISTLDPNVIIAMEYDDEGPGFVGVRYVTMKDSQVFSYEREIDTSELKIVDMFEVEDTKSELMSEGDESEVISWDDLWEKQKDLLAYAYKELKNNFPHAYPDPSLRFRS